MVASDLWLLTDLDLSTTFERNRPLSTENKNLGYTFFQCRLKTETETKCEECLPGRTIKRVKTRNKRVGSIRDTRYVRGLL